MRNWNSENYSDYTFGAPEDDKKGIKEGSGNWRHIGTSANGSADMMCMNEGDVVLEVDALKSLCGRLNSTAAGLRKEASKNNSARLLSTALTKQAQALSGTSKDCAIGLNYMLKCHNEHYATRDADSVAAKTALLRVCSQYIHVATSDRNDPESGLASPNHAAESELVLGCIEAKVGQ